MPAAVETAPTDGERSAGISLPGLWAFVAVALPVVTALEARISTIDLAYQIRAGEIILRTRHLVRVDPFTFTAAGRPWLDQQWGAQVLLALLHRAGGWATLAVARAALVGVVFLLVYLACRAAGASVKGAAWLALGSFVIAVEGLAMRPQLMGMALFALTLWLVASRRDRPGRLWAVPAVVAVWANVHGSFFLGPLVLGLAWLDDLRGHSPRSRATSWVALASLAAATLNPFGLHVWSYTVAISTNPMITRNITEWAPPTIREFTGAAFFVSVAAVTAFFALRGKRIAWPHLLTLGLFFAMGLAAGRGDFWWALVAPVVVAANLPQRRERPERVGPPAWVNTAIAVLLVALGVSFLPGVRDHNPMLADPTLLSDAPAGIAAELERALAPGARVFAPQRWGSWFELAVPEDPVFVDSRIEVFPSSVWRQYRDVSFGLEGWQEVLDRWDVTAVVVHPVQQADLLPRIREDPGWRLAYRDADGYLFLRA